MRQPMCKRLSIFLLALFIVNFSAQAQDTSKTVAKPTPKTVAKPSKTGTSTSTKPAAGTLAKPTTSTQAKSATTPTQTKPATATPSKPGTPAPTKPVPPQTNVATAPAPASAGPTDNTLNGQYEALLKHSWMQQGYKVINPSKLTTLWRSVNDSLNNSKKQLAEAKRKLDEQSRQIAQLKDKTTGTSNAQQGSAVSVNQLEFLGMDVDVSTYNLIVWGIIGILGLGLAGVLFTFTKNSLDAKQHRQQYEEISAEYQTYKTKAKEKELKLARELQTERNTIEELLAKKNEDEPPVKRGKR